jgi:hypothetical protein
LISKPKIGVLLLILVIVGWLTVNQQKDWNGWKTPENHTQVINSDGAGYYAYLPQIFIYKDPKFRFVENLKKTYPDGKFDQFSRLDSLGNRSDKFFTGTAILQAPFFLFAHYFHPDTYPSDGYSYPYQLSVVFATGFYLLLGLFLLGLLLFKLKFSIPTVVLTLILITFGSPLYYYTIQEPSLSHVYSFAIITAFALSLFLWIKEKNIKLIYAIGLLFGLVVILRPINGLVCLGYFFFFSSFKEAFAFLRLQLTKNIAQFIGAMVLMALPILVQCLSVYYQSGHFSFNLYGKEGFDHLTNPFIGEVLFGFRKGLFIYAPICLFALIVPFFLWKNNRTLAIGSTLFFLLFTYFTASWWCWWYGGSLGMRPYIDISVLFALALAFLIEKSNLWLKIIWIGIIFFCIHYQLVLSHQMRKGILHFDGLTKEQYKKVFLKKDRRFEWMFHIGPGFEIPKNAKKVEELSWSNKVQRFVPSTKAENMVLQGPYNEIIYPLPNDSTKSRYIQITADCLLDEAMNIPKFQLFRRINGQEKEIAYSMFGMQISNLNEFSHIESSFEIPKDLDSFYLRLEVTHGEMRMKALRMGLYR